jgi:hypothetical protein
MGYTEAVFTNIDIIDKFQEWILFCIVNVGRFTRNGKRLH